MSETVSIYPTGENALTISFGNTIDQEINRRVFKLYQFLLTAAPPFWIDLIPAYSSLTIIYNPAFAHGQPSTTFDWVKQKIEEALTKTDRIKLPVARHVTIPLCYHSQFALDMKLVCEQKKISTEELIKLHSQQVYHVYMLGFLPGFTYLGTLDSRIATPRLATPRTQVTAGSVGIAGVQTGIYPLDSPGGWNIIGRTPVKIFDFSRTKPVLLYPGDAVEFNPISLEEFENFDPINYQLTQHEH